MLPLAGKAQGIFHPAYPCEALRVCKVHICVLWPCRISLTVSTSLRKMKACKAFPWPGQHNLATSTPTALQNRLPIHTASYTNRLCCHWQKICQRPFCQSSSTGRRCARDPSINPAVQAAVSQHLSPGASTEPATLSNTKFTIKTMGKDDWHLLI